MYFHHTKNFCLPPNDESRKNKNFGIFHNSKKYAKKVDPFKIRTPKKSILFFTARDLGSVEKKMDAKKVDPKKTRSFFKNFLTPHSTFATSLGISKQKKKAKGGLIFIQNQVLMTAGGHTLVHGAAATLRK